jgi:cell division protein FtsB
VHRRTKREHRRRFKIRWIIIFLVIAIPLFYLGRKVYAFAHSRQYEADLKKEILILEAENEVLQNRIEEYKKGNLLEAKARDELGMIKKDEKIYIIQKK